MWSRFALCRQAKEIRIFDKSNYDFCTTTILPTFKSQFLVTLEIASCASIDQFQVELGCLKKLSLDRVWITNENFQRFISGCPSLQELIIVNPYEMNKLSLSAPNIDKLSLVLLDEHLLNHPNPLFLSFPYIKNLYLEINSWKLEFIDVSSARNIYIKYLNFYMNPHDDLVLTINQALVRKFEGIEAFRLSCDASKEFLHSAQNLELIQCKWRRIVLELQDFCNSCVLGMYHLMKSLPHLEELVIYTTEEFKASRGSLRIYFPPPPYVTPQLKTITLHGYRKSWKSRVRLVELLLKRAAALEKLIIVPINYRLQEKEELEFVQHLSRFRKASPTARVIFS